MEAMWLALPTQSQFNVGNLDVLVTHLFAAGDLGTVCWRAVRGVKRDHKRRAALRHSDGVCNKTRPNSFSRRQVLEQLVLSVGRSEGLGHSIRVAVRRDWHNRGVVVVDRRSQDKIVDRCVLVPDVWSGDSPVKRSGDVLWVEGHRSLVCSTGCCGTRCECRIDHTRLDNVVHRMRCFVPPTANRKPRAHNNAD